MFETTTSCSGHPDLRHDAIDKWAAIQIQQTEADVKYISEILSFHILGKYVRLQRCVGAAEKRKWLERRAERVASIVHKWARAAHTRRAHRRTPWSHLGHIHDYCFITVCNGD